MVIVQLGFLKDFNESVRIGGLYCARICTTKRWRCWPCFIHPVSSRLIQRKHVIVCEMLRSSSPAHYGLLSTTHHSSVNCVNY